VFWLIVASLLGGLLSSVWSSSKASREIHDCWLLLPESEIPSVGAVRCSSTGIPST
jgi:hypothetical protein